MPKVWRETVATHRQAVREAIMDTTAALAARHGVLELTMSQIAAEVGIGRATLYKYFPDVESILLAWHQRQVNDHLERLAEVRDRATEPRARLRSVLEAFALIQYESRNTDIAQTLHHNARLAGALHSGAHTAQATQQLLDFLAELLAENEAVKELRTDTSRDELAAYCAHALTAAANLSSKAAVRRLVDLVLTGLRPPA